MDGDQLSELDELEEAEEIEEMEALTPSASAQTFEAADVMQRVNELLSKMTIEEKAMRLSCANPMALIGPYGLMREQLDSLIGQGTGIARRHQ